MFSFNAALVVTRDPELYARDHTTFLRDAYRYGAQFHHDRHIPRHFLPFARAKYGYPARKSRANAGVFEAAGLNPWSPGEPRNQPYQGFKDKLGLPDLVLSGALQARVTSQYKITATATRGARLQMQMPDYAGGATGRLRVKKGQTEITDQQRNILQRQAEMETISPDEHQRLAEEIGADYTRQANEPGVQKRIQIT
jgi:hypothetical protein